VIISPFTQLHNSSDRMQVAVIINRDRRCLYEFRKKQMRHSLNRGLEEMSAAPLHGVEFADERDDQRRVLCRIGRKTRAVGVLPAS
jgi:hypothetical protein